MTTYLGMEREDYKNMASEYSMYRAYRSERNR